MYSSDTSINPVDFAINSTGFSSTGFTSTGLLELPNLTEGSVGNLFSESIDIDLVENFSSSTSTTSAFDGVFNVLSEAPAEYFDRIPLEPNQIDSLTGESPTVNADIAFDDSVLSSVDQPLQSSANIQSSSWYYQNFDINRGVPIWFQDSAGNQVGLEQVLEGWTRS